MNKQIASILVVLIAATITLQCTEQSAQKASYNDVNEWVSEVKQQIDTLSPTALKELMDSGKVFLLIDVREREEHDAAYIPGSVLIPRGLLEFRIANPEFWEEEGLYEPLKDEMLILYCRSGNRSAFAAASLEKLGYTNVYSLTGGFNQWKELFPDLFEYNEAPIDPDQIGPVAEEESGGSC